MIRINLLPEEYRRKERSSWKVLGLTVFGALLVSCSLGYFAYAWFGVLAKVQHQRQVVEETLATKLQRAKYSDNLEKEKKNFMAREKTIKNIRTKRVLWTRKLDQFVDVINNDGNANNRHLCWFHGMEVKPMKYKRKKKAIRMKLKGHSAGKDIGKVSNLIDDITAHSFFEGFIHISEPGGSQEDIQENLEPKESVAFPLEMYLLPGKGKKGEKSK